MKLGDYTNQIQFFLDLGYLQRWNCISKLFRFLQITNENQDSRFIFLYEYQDRPVFTVFLTRKTSSQNISITLSQIGLNFTNSQGGYWRKKLSWSILEEQFPVQRNTAANNLGNSVMSLLWQLRCHRNPDLSKFSSLSNTGVVVISPNLC